MKINQKSLLSFFLVPLIFVSCATTEKVTEEKDIKDTVYFYNHSVSAIQMGNDKGYENIINEWKNTIKEDVERDIVEANYFIEKGITSTITYSETKPEKGEYTHLYDDKQNKDIYIYPVYSYTQEYIDKASDILEKSIKKNPDRLDIWFGLTHIYLQSKAFNKGEDVLTRCFSRYKENDGDWLWSFNKPWFDTKEERDREFSLSLHNYLETLYSEKTKETYDIAQRISNQILELFPNSPIVYNYLAVDYMLNGNEEKGGEYLLKAHKLDPNDLVIVDNLAYYYLRNNNEEGFNYAVSILENSNDINFLQRSKALRKKYNEMKNK